MAKLRLEKVRALFYVLQQLTKRGCANFDTASVYDAVINQSDELAHIAKYYNLKSAS